MSILKKIGYKIKTSDNSVYLKSIKKLNSVKIKTAPFPGLATDSMPMLLALLTKVPGKSEILENIFSNRFMAAPELSRMGAKIKVKRNKAVILGTRNLFGADCISSDLRTTFSIILGALSATGTSKIHRIYHGLRGYSNLEKNLKKMGVKIKSVEK